MSIGDKIKEYRQSLKLSQKEFSKRAKISRSYLGDLENNRRNPSIKTIEKIAINLDIPTSDLLETENEIHFSNFDWHEENENNIVSVSFSVNNVNYAVDVEIIIHHEPIPILSDSNCPIFISTPYEQTQRLFFFRHLFYQALTAEIIKEKNYKIDKFDRVPIVTFFRDIHNNIKVSEVLFYP